MLQAAFSNQVDNAEDGPFATAAYELRNYGLAPLPLGGDDGKVPLVSSFTNWRRILGESTLANWASKWPQANVGIVTELSGVSVIDIDDPDLLDTVIDQFGDTPLKTSTPSGGIHLWFLGSGESSRIRIGGFPVDIKAAGGMVVVPPSTRPSGPFKGREYGFLAGSWENLRELPTMKNGNLQTPIKIEGTGPKVGQRNDALFRYLLNQVRHCDCQDDLLDVAISWNLDCLGEPLPDNEIIRTCASVWKINQEKRNWIGGSGMCQMPVLLLERLLLFSPKHGADAVCLYLKLQKEHAARDARGEVFPVAAEAMAKSGSVPWSAYKIRNALGVLRSFPLLKVVKWGGTGQGDAHLYRFCSPFSL